jgi:hypothetical protein
MHIKLGCSFNNDWFGVESLFAVSQREVMEQMIGEKEKEKIPKTVVCDKVF